jgi:hypothetical protein
MGDDFWGRQQRKTNPLQLTPLLNASIPSLSLSKRSLSLSPPLIAPKKAAPTSHPPAPFVQHLLPKLQAKFGQGSQPQQGLPRHPLSVNFNEIRLNHDSPLPIQTKLTIGQPNDQYEQEADRVADQVMSMPAPTPQSQVQRMGAEKEEELQTKLESMPLIQRQAEDEEELQTKPKSTPIIQRVGAEEDEELQAKPENIPIIQRMGTDEEEELQAKRESISVIQRQTDEEEELQAKPESTPAIQRQANEEEELQAKSTGQSATTDHSTTGQSLESRLAASSGSGTPLAPEVLTFMEPRFGVDFSSVRIHTSSEAVQMNRDLQAQAFTHDRDIYFGSGKYDPSSNAGKQLLAHELTHVVQQTGGVQKKCAACEEEDKGVQRQVVSNHTLGQRISREMIPGYANEFRARPQLTTQRPVIQRAKIDHRTLTWADFKGKAPKSSSFDAETHSHFHDPNLSKLKPAKFTAVDTGTKCKIGKKDSAVFKVNIAIDPASVEVKPYMWQEKSWAMPWTTDAKAREEKCTKLVVGKCESFFTEQAKKIASSCKKTEQGCIKAFGKKGTATYKIEMDGQEATATDKGECNSVIFEQCKTLSSKTLKWSGSMGSQSAEAKSAAECKSIVLKDCVGKWLKSDSERLLAHEQAHFDITNVLAGKSQTALRTLVSSFAKEVQDCGEAKALSKASSAFDKNLKALQKELEKSIKGLGKTQSKYDLETKHGLKIKEQKDWETKISKGLP